MILNFHRKIVLKQTKKKKLNPVEVRNKKYKRRPQVLVWCGRHLFGEANCSRDFSKQIPESPTSGGRIPRPEISRGIPGRGRGFGDARCTYDIHTHIHTYLHTCIHKYMHTNLINIHTYIQTNIHTYIHTYIHT